MNEEGYMHAIAALQYFAMPGDAQVASWREDRHDAPPSFFDEVGIQVDNGCNYFFGVGCVYITYAGCLYSRFLSMDEAEHLKDFHHRLNVYMTMHRTVEEWSDKAVLGSRHWESLRSDAKKALIELGEPLPSVVPKFEIAALINPDEFRVSDEVRRLLD